MRPRVLMLCQVLPFPLDAGPKVRAYHVLRWLAERADVHLACFVRPDDPPEAIEHLRGVCAGVHVVGLRRSRARDALHLARALATGAPFVVVRDDVAAMRDLVDRLAASQAFDAVHADQLWMARYARDVPATLKVLDDHNATYRIFERLARHAGSPARRVLLRREARLLARYELDQLAAFDRVLYVSEADRAAMLAVAGAADAERIAVKAAVVPIGVDVAAVAPIAARRAPRRVTVLGTLFWPPNVEGVLWFAEHVLPRLLHAVPGANLTLIGKQPPEAVSALARRFPGAVEVTGYVADPRPYLEETAVFAVPLLSGGGMRVKVLDAWAWGLPVVSTAVGAEGIDARAGVELLIADTPGGFAEACALLLNRPALRARIGAAGRAAVAERYDVRRVYTALGPVYAPVLGGRDGAVAATGEADPAGRRTRAATRATTL